MKISVNQLKLKWKIFAFLTGFCALLLIILWLFQTVFLTEMYKHVRGIEIQKAITLVEQNIESPDLQNIIIDLAENKEILVTPTQDFTPPRMLQDDRFKPRQESITSTKVFTLQGGQTISLTFHAIISPVEATVATLRVQLYFITGIMLILAIFLAFIIAKRVSKPIEEINKSAKILAGGNYDIHFNGKGFREIGELSDTLNHAADDLNKVEALRRELMANISHDLRTPLSLIYSYAEMMHDFPEEITGDQTQTIMDETQRLSSLVDDVLDISKLETGMQQLNLSAFNLTRMIRVSADRIAELAKKDGYQIDFTYDQEITITADEVKITQALYNLLVNAINYTGIDKTVAIHQTISGDFVRIEVIDTGEGLDEKNLLYIWDRYYRGDENHKRAVTGTGLGLSIVKKVIELHGGSYGVSSQIGKGSTFWFELKI